MALKPCLALPLRRIYALGGTPAAYYIRDRDAGGILVNAADPAWAQALAELGGVRYLFLPSAAGAGQAAFWCERGAEVLVHEREPVPPGLSVTPVGPRQRLTRTIDFLPLPGASVGTCALFLKNKPGVVFAGPALRGRRDPEPPGGEDALLSMVHLAGLRFHYLFWDHQDPHHAPYGPDAAKRLRERLERHLSH